MEKSRLDRFEVEKLANTMLPTVLYKEENDTLTFNFESLGYHYDVAYKKNIYGHWEMFHYMAKECCPNIDVK